MEKVLPASQAWNPSLGMPMPLGLLGCSSLQSFSASDALSDAREVHAHFVRHGFETSTVATEAESLNCDNPADGFGRGSSRAGTAASWTANISSYCDAGKYREALSCYNRMQEEGVDPNQHTLVGVLKACTKLEDLAEGRRVHADATRHGWESDVFVGSSLISMYSKCGSIVAAEQVFERLLERNVVAWTSMIAAYAQKDQGSRALQVYQQMMQEGVSPNARTFVSALQACGSVAEKEDGALVGTRNVKVEALRMGREIHSRAASMGFESDIFVGNSLVSMYSKCGSIEDAELAFDSLERRTVVSWTAIITAYAKQDQGERALHRFQQMKEEGFRPNTWTLVSAVQACSRLAEKEEGVIVDGRVVKLRSLKKAREINAVATEMGLASDTFVGNAVLSLYAACGSLKNAEEAFNGLSHRDVVSWTAMIAAYAQEEEGEKALLAYQRMKAAGVWPNARTFVSTIQACGSLGAREVGALVGGQSVKVDSLKVGRKLHAEAISRGFASDVFVGSTLINMYAKCGSIKDAEHVFLHLSARNVVSWNAMIAAYAQQEQGERALQLYARMQEEGVPADEATFVSVLEACSITGALDTCARTHQSILESKLERSLSVATSLIHAYGKCGSMVDAHRVFDTLPWPDVVTWNALIVGYARLGSATRSMQCYKNMLQAGLKPTAVTFLALLSACSHSGMVKTGLEHFENMIKEHGIEAELDHYVCVLDLLGRAGLFGKTKEVLTQMPMEPDLNVWLCVLAACRKHVNVELGRIAFDRAVSLEPKHAATYKLMSNIYANAGMPESANQVDELRRRAVGWRKPSQSWIEHDQKVHTFLVADCRHPEKSALFAVLNRLTAQLEEMGYMKNTDRLGILV